MDARAKSQKYGTWVRDGKAEPNADVGWYAGRARPMRLRLFSLIVLSWLPVSLSWAQETPQTQSDTTALKSDSFLPETPAAKSPPVPEQHPRLFWIIPTYTVTNSKSPAPLTSHEKFRLYMADKTDPYTFGFIAFNAGLAQATNAFAGYGQGAAGYAKRLGAGTADEASGGFFGTFLFPSLLHQDPRFYRQGSGPLKRRLAHVLIRPLVTHKDSGERTFNWSGSLGRIAASGLANAYYPAEERGVGRTFSRAAMGIPYSIIDDLVDEFGPDLQKKFFKRQPRRK